MRVRLEWSLALAATLLVLSASGCSGGGSGDSGDQGDPVTMSTPHEKPTKAPAPDVPRFTTDILASDCRAFMDRNEIRRVAGANLAFFQVARLSGENDAALSCQAPIYNERGNGSWITLAVVRAHEALPLWRSELEAVDGSPSISAEQQRVVTESLTAIRGGRLDDAQSCRIFSSLTEMMWQQQPAATYSVTVRTPPSQEALDARACTEGVFVHVFLVGDPDVNDTAGLREHVRAAVASYSPGELIGFE